MARLKQYEVIQPGNSLIPVSGKKYPIPTLTNIARKIQRVRKRSGKLIIFLCIGLQFVALIIIG